MDRVYWTEKQDAILSVAFSRGLKDCLLKEADRWGLSVPDLVKTILVEALIDLGHYESDTGYFRGK